MKKIHFGIISVFLIVFSVKPVMAQLTATHLRCEYKENPVGIDVTRPRLSWQLQSPKQHTVQTAYQLRAAHSQADLEKGKHLLWNSGKVNSDSSIQLVYNGPALQSRERVYWQVRVWDNHQQVSKWSTPHYWEMGLLSPDEWTAKWIYPGFQHDTLHSQPAPYFRHDFDLKKKIKSARIYVTSLGLYDLFLNGKKVGDRVFTPGWTSYNKRLQYQTYDVTDQLSEGGNAIGAILGDGWYRGQIGWEDYNRNRYGTKLALLLQLEVTYTDGTKAVISTDKSWKVNTGPIISSDIYDGETYDATKAFKDWTSADYNDSQWRPVQLLDHTKQTLVASYGPPVKDIQEIKPIKLITTPKGEKVFDLGQNMVGWVRLKVKGKRGDTVRLKFAEVLDKEGNFYTANLRKAKSTETYILSGDGEETYEPHFTFHGFRYVKVEGYPGQLQPDDITGIVVHSAITPTGHFACSDSLVNQLWHNIIWSQQGNFLDVPTDCPQRDERLGWTGDAQVFAPTACFNYNTAAFFTKWLKDLTADQWSNGMVPDVIPDILNINHDPGLNGKPFWGGSTGWADVSVIIPWDLYLYYGDRRVLQNQYASMQAWINYMKNRAGSDFLWTGDQHYGDWLSFNTDASDYPGAYTDQDMIATAYFAHSTDLMSKIAKVLGKDEDAQNYRQLFENIKKAFDKTYITPAGYLMSNTQTAYSLAIKFHLLPDNMVPLAAKHLAAQVEKFGHITTGFLGTPIICPVLTETGYDSLAYHLLMRKTYPSWLYPVTMGATTIWERWDGIKPDSTFQTVSMNSFNHYAYGAIGEWLYTVVAGIKMDTTHPAFQKILLQPHPGGGLSWAKASYESSYGEIMSGWQIENGQMHYDITVPPNTQAQVTLPGVNAENVQLNGSDISDNKLISHYKSSGEDVVFDVGSGSYSFTYPYQMD